MVDDERTAIDALRRELGAYQELEIKGTANNGAKGKKMIMELRPDLLFLDEMCIRDRIESETLKWNSTKEEWEKDLRINYTYEGKTVTTNYYKWNNKKRAYVLVPEMTVTMDNTNL